MFGELSEQRETWNLVLVYPLALLSFLIATRHTVMQSSNLKLDQGFRNPLTPTLRGLHVVHLLRVLAGRDI